MSLNNPGAIGFRHSCIQVPKSCPHFLHFCVLSSAMASFLDQFF